LKTAQAVLVNFDFSLTDRQSLQNLTTADTTFFDNNLSLDGAPSLTQKCKIVRNLTFKLNSTN
jgi:hypothetical protein